MAPVRALFVRAVARWRLLALFVAAFALSLWWSDAGIDRPRGPVFVPSPPVRAQAPGPEGVAAVAPAAEVVTAVAPAVPVARAAVQSPPEHAGGDNAPGIGLEPEPEPAPE